MGTGNRRALRRCSLPPGQGMGSCRLPAAPGHLAGALTSLRDGEGLRSGVGGQRRHYSLLQVPNWKLLEASPLSGGSLSVSG